jgi:hypothetical protein
MKRIHSSELLGSAARRRSKSAAVLGSASASPLARACEGKEEVC